MKIENLQEVVRYSSPKMGLDKVSKQLDAIRHHINKVGLKVVTNKVVAYPDTSIIYRDDDGKIVPSKCSLLENRDFFNRYDSWPKDTVITVTNLSRIVRSREAYDILCRENLKRGFHLMVLSRHKKLTTVADAMSIALYNRSNGHKPKPNKVNKEDVKRGITHKTLSITLTMGSHKLSNEIGNIGIINVNRFTIPALIKRMKVMKANNVHKVIFTRGIDDHNTLVRIKRCLLYEEHIGLVLTSTNTHKYYRDAGVIPPGEVIILLDNRLQRTGPRVRKHKLIKPTLELPSDFNQFENRGCSKKDRITIRRLLTDIEKENLVVAVNRITRFEDKNNRKLAVSKRALIRLKSIIYNNKKYSMGTLRHIKCRYPALSTSTEKTIITRRTKYHCGTPLVDFTIDKISSLSKESPKRRFEISYGRHSLYEKNNMV